MIRFKIAFLFLLLTPTLKAQIINIPDSAFKKYLTDPIYSRWGSYPSPFDTNGDKEIDLDEAKKITYIGNIGYAGSINQNIQDLTGIEYFENLETLTCNYSKLSKLNLKNLKKLKSVSSVFNFNLLESIDVSGCTALETIDCGSNPITTLNVTGAVSLKTIRCPYNALVNIDFSELQNLEEIDLSYGQLQSLQLKNNPKLKIINTSFNPTLQKIDLSAAIGLETFYCTESGLKELNLSNLSNLKTVNCYRNNLTELKLSNLSNLQTIDCSYNQLQKLDATGALNLNSLNCSYNTINEINLKGLNFISDLNCSYNQLLSLDIKSAKTTFTNISCDHNKIKKLDLKEINLSGLHCSFNQIEFLDLSWQGGLGCLYCNDNNLKHINVSKTYIYLGKNDCKDLTNNPDLAFVCADDFQINDFKSYFASVNMHHVLVSEKCYFKPMIWPNPISDTFQINSLEPIKTIRIYSSNGVMVHESHPGTYGDKVTGLSALNKGLYLVEVTDITGQVNTSKIMKN